MRTRRTRAIAGIIFALACIGLAWPAMASPENGSAASEVGANVVGMPTTANVDFSSDVFLVRGQGVKGEQSEAETVDARTAARANGEAVEKYLARTAGSNDFAVAMTQIEQKFPDLVTRYGIPPVGETGANWVIAPTSSAERLRAELAKLGSDTEVRLGAPAGINATETSVAAAFAELRNSGQVEKMTSSYDFENMHLVIKYEPTAKATVDSASQAINSAENAVRTVRGDDYRSGEIQFVPAEGLPVSRVMTTVQGGRHMARPSDGTSVCTTGFAANRSTNVGLVTAQHCANDLRYRNIADVITFGSNADNLPNALIDLQFHRTVAGHDAGTRFYGVSTSDDRYVTSVANTPINASSCKWGTYGFYGCGALQDQAQCNPPAPNGNVFCGIDVFDVMTPNSMTYGDSGGPVFYQNQARGIVEGGLVYGDVILDNRATRIGRVESSLHATIREYGGS